MNAGLPLQPDSLAGAAGASRWRLLVCFACLLLPWLNPRAGGPSSSVEPWLFSAFCMAIALGTQGPAALRRAMGPALAAAAGWALARSGFSPEALALAAACLLVYMAASMAAAGCSRPELVRAIALAWLVAASVSTGIAVLQYFGSAGAFDGWISAAAPGEAFANLRQRNQFASLTVIGMASLFWLMPRGLGRWPAMAAMCWLAFGNAATTSRTGLLQLLMLGVLACGWPGPRRERALLWLAGLLAYGVAMLALPSLLETALGLPASRLWDRVAGVEACSSRRVLWSNVLALTAQKPWLGWGWGELDYAHFVTLYNGPRFCDILDNAHNLPLHLAVELGLPAALFACVGLVWAVVRAAPWRESDATRQMAWAVLAVIALHSLLEYPLWYGPFQLAFGLCLGLLWPAPGAREAPSAVARSGAVALAMVVVLASAYAAWDYRRVSQIYLPADSRAPSLRDDPLPHARKSWLFRNQARFAELTITPLTAANAQWMFDSAADLLHYSPEPRVVEKLIESGAALGRSDEMLLHLARFRAAFPEAYAKWSQAAAGRRVTPR